MEWTGHRPRVHTRQYDSVLRPYVPVCADVNTDAIAPIMIVVGREYRVGRSRALGRERTRRAPLNPLQINGLAPSAEHAWAWWAAESRDNGMGRRLQRRATEHAHREDRD